MAVFGAKVIGMAGCGAALGCTTAKGLYFWMDSIPREVFTKLESSVKSDTLDKEMVLVIRDDSQEDSKNVVDFQKSSSGKKSLSLTTKDYQEYVELVKQKNKELERQHLEAIALTNSYNVYRHANVQNIKEVSTLSKDGKTYRTWIRAYFKASLYEQGWRLQEDKKQYKETDIVFLVNAFDNRRVRGYQFKDVFYISHKKLASEHNGLPWVKADWITDKINNLYKFEKRFLVKEKDDFCSEIKARNPEVEVSCNFQDEVEKVSRPSEEKEMLIIF